MRWRQRAEVPGAQGLNLTNRDLPGSFTAFEPNYKSIGFSVLDWYAKLMKKGNDHAHGCGPKGATRRQRRTHAGCRDGSSSRRPRPTPQSREWGAAAGRYDPRGSPTGPIVSRPIRPADDSDGDSTGAETLKEIGVDDRVARRSVKEFPPWRIEVVKKVARTTA